MNYTNSIDLAIKLAMKSPFKHKIGSVVLDAKGNIIASAYNNRKTHPLQHRHAARTGHEHRQFLHAEIAALVKCREQPHTILTLRVGKDGGLRNARPCEICMSAIDEAKVKYIVYSTNDGVFKNEQVTSK